MTNYERKKNFISDYFALLVIFYERNNTLIPLIWEKIRASFKAAISYLQIVADNCVSVEIEVVYFCNNTQWSTTMLNWMKLKSFVHTRCVFPLLVDCIRPLRFLKYRNTSIDAETQQISITLWRGNSILREPA